MHNRKLKENVHVGGVWGSLAILRNILRSGHATLRRPTKAKPKQRDIVTRYFVLQGIVIALGHMIEGARLLVKIEPSLASVVAPFENDFETWKRFRDDAAHVVDRTHYESLRSQNDALINLDEYGYDTDVLRYDDKNDLICTGLSDSLNPGDAIERADQLLLALAATIAIGYRNGSIPPPPRLAAAMQ